MRKYSRGRLHLINITPDGDYLFPIKRILYKVGYYTDSKSYSEVFKIEVNASIYKNIGYNKMIKLYVNRKDEKLELLVIDNKGRKIDIDVSWSFDILKEKLNLKLKYLVIVKAENKIIDGDEYFKYSEISFYELRDFDKFLSLIE